MAGHPFISAIRHIARAVAIGALLAVAVPGAFGEDLTVDEVLRHIKIQDEAIEDETAEVVIRSVDAKGLQKSSTHRMYWKNPKGQKGLLGKTLLITRSPPNKKGEGFLLWQAERAGDSQAWIYLPDMRQALRVTIAGHDAHRERESEVRLGFEQLGTRLIGVGDRRLVGRETFDGGEYLILEDRPPTGAYAVHRLWISLANWTIGKIEYRDAADRLRQTQRIEWQQVGGAWVWKRTEIEMADAPGKTIVDVGEVAVNTGLDDRLFSVQTLKSGKLP